MGSAGLCMYGYYRKLLIVTCKYVLIRTCNTNGVTPKLECELLCGLNQIALYRVFPLHMLAYVDM